MKIIFSYVNSSIKRYMDFNMAKISLKLVKKYGYKTVLYVDEANYHKFDKLDYDEKIILNQSILNQFPHNIWSLGKLLVFSQIEEPFFHIDFDLFMIEDHFKFFLNKPLVSLHKEQWVNMNMFAPDFEKASKQIPYLQNILYENIKSYNCAIVGGTAIKEINKSAEIILDYAINNKEYFLQRDSYYKYDWACSVFFEQILFMNICKNIINNISLFLDEETSDYRFQKLLNLSGAEGLDFIQEEMIRKKIIHLWGSKEKLMKNIHNYKNLE